MLKIFLAEIYLVIYIIGDWSFK